MSAIKRFSLSTTSSEFPTFRKSVMPYSAVLPGSNTANVLTIVDCVAFAPVPKNFRDIAEIIAEREENPKRAAALARARVRLSKQAYADTKTTLAALRLRAGLSQERLAKMLGNSQSSYSLVEAGKREIMLSTFEKLHEILKVSRDELAEALRNSKANHS